MQTNLLDVSPPKSCITALLALSTVWAAAEKRPGKEAPARGGTLQFKEYVGPLLAEFCFRCHGGGKAKGDVVLDKWISEADAARDSVTWERVLKVIRNGEMPPENKPQPSDRQRAHLTRWIEDKVFPCDPENSNPGRAPIRRLNRSEYNNTIRDLLGVDFKPADDFPVDDSGHGFDNMADALSLSPMLIEKYLAAAEKIINTAFVSDGHHDISHHGGNAEKKEKLARINRFHMTQFAYCLERLKSVREGEGTLLDNCMIVYGSGIADGNAHSHHDLPVLLAGRGGGALATGRHIRFPKDTPMTNLYLAMLERMGVNSERLGDSTGVLKGLS